MIKIKKQKPVKIDGRYFVVLPKNVVDVLGIDEQTEVETVVGVYKGRVWNSCKGEWVN